MFASKLM